MIALGLLFIAAGTGVHLEEVGELPLETAIAVVESLSRAIAARTGQAPVFDDPAWSACESADRCLTEIMGRTHAEEVVFARVFGGPSLIHLSLDRVTPGAKSAKSTEVDLPRERARWDEPLAVAARALFPEPPPPPRNEALVGPGPAPVAPRSFVSAALPWVAIGAGVAAGALGAVLGASSADAKDQLEQRVVLQREHDELADRVRDQGLAANLLFGAAAAGVVTGVVLLIVE